jgi:hypothetical protein
MFRHYYQWGELSASANIIFRRRDVLQCEKEPSGKSRYNGPEEIDGEIEVCDRQGRPLQ